MGLPGAGYPYSWAINRWIDGEHPTQDGSDLHRLAVDLGGFVARLRKADAAGARAGHRTGSLRTRDGYVREWTAAARGIIDTRALLAAWEEALAAPEWDGPPVWTHGDLLAGNLLVRGGRLSAVIDFGTAGVGDPACDALAAWALFGTGSREAYRSAAGFDDPTWARGRGWALTFVSGLTYYRQTNPVMADLAARTIDAVLADPA